MKHALLIGVADERPEQRFRPGPSLAAMECLLGELGGWSIKRVEGPSASRDGILEALAGLEAVIEPRDTCLFYFAGHGGVVEIHDLPPPLGGRPVFYVTAARSGEQWSFEAVLDIELSLRLARIDRVCANVSAILDCCYSARTVRGPAWSLHESPAWLRILAEVTAGRADHDGLTSPTSHPRIVRLAAASALRTGFAEAQAEGHLGRLTRLFDEVVREAIESSVGRLTWDAVAHRVREGAIWRLGCEEQWVSLAGPRQRLVFSREEVALPRTVGFVPHEREAGGWLRAGALQGVAVGDEWGLTHLTLDTNLRPRLRSRMRVIATDLNRALLEPIEGEASAPPGTTAIMLRARDRARVLVDGPSGLADAVDRSAWLRASDGEGRALGALTVHEGAIEVRSIDNVHGEGIFSRDESGEAAAIERLEDWARAALILEVAYSRNGGPSGPISASLGSYEFLGGRQMARERAAKATIQSFHVGDRMYLRISVRGDWFVAPVEIDVAGRPVLLDASEPDGRELLDHESWIVGENPHRQIQGIERVWPTGLTIDQPRRASIVVLASRRPIQLGHLVDIAEHPGDTPRRRRASNRGHLSGPRPRTGPELARDWTAVVIPYELDPRPRLHAVPSDT